MTEQVEAQARPAPPPQMPIWSDEDSPPPEIVDPVMPPTEEAHSPDLEPVEPVMPIESAPVS